MPSVELPNVALNFESILMAVAVIVAICGVLAAFVKGWESWKKISVRDRVKDLEDRMKKVENRLDAGNRRFSHQSEDMGQILQTLAALQVHFISGNDHEKLKESNEKLVEYMNKRATRDAEEM